ncbi:TIGR03086 family metal-binding protein [Nocardioides mangrovi]|uniref:TIGR03086 family protein n=1 Tax=Nocardioides mangrovi TaxID=2874580 RepID=A0ABS7UG29_9ACTN|nr:TIGR03086 family metal-binding protein [Nocardioides mangrovi]MBZ5739784.1 TIGR03086 family protein [Nocardioides mangrovi]
MDDLAHAQEAMAAVLADLAASDWHLPSPCEGWEVGTVVRHLVTGDRAFVTSLGGTAYDLPAIALQVDAIPLGELPAAYDAGAVALHEALTTAEPGTAYPTGIGPMPPAAIAELRTIESLVHGWDVARGTGRALEVDEAVAERAIAHSLALMDRLPPDRTPFGPPQPVPDDAPAMARLVALLGRAV